MVPNHVAIILDGNRRFARKLGLDPIKGHEYGAKKLLEVAEWLKEAGVKELTLYTLSTENLKRTPIEVTALMMLFRKAVEKATEDERIQENKVKIRFIGRLQHLPKDIQESFSRLEEKTKNNTGYKINFAIAYGGKAEIVDAANKIIKDAKDGKIDSVDENKFSQYLYLSDEPDLLIRPGGEKRISNFILWQMAYTEYIFMDKLFPELTKQDILDCLAEYERRERRMGK